MWGPEVSTFSYATDIDTVADFRSQVGEFREVDDDISMMATVHPPY